MLGRNVDTVCGMFNGIAAVPHLIGLGGLNAGDP